MIKIAHISDQQIRTFKRHKEYRECFEVLYQSLEDTKPDYIVFVGDFVHQKSNTSPELFDMCVDHIKNLASLCHKLVIIPGNHDGVLNNKSRLDTLTPIIKAIDMDNIYYFKESKIYSFDDIDLAVFSCFDDDTSWPEKKDFLEDRLNIGLFHGMVQGAKLQNGQIVEECPYKLGKFLDMVDYLLLGDIHQMQILDVNYRAGYCGSYPQQNYSESVEKGYLLWKIEDKKKHSVDFVKLPSLYPFYSIYLDNTLSIPTDLKFQKNARIRVVSRGLTSAEKKKIMEDVNHFYSPLDIDFLEIDTKEKHIVIGDDSSKIENLEDAEVQEKLIKDFLSTYNLTEDKMESVLELNNKYETKDSEDTIRNVQYIIEKMNFSNLFSYGEDNEFDFSKRKGIIGIFGKNGVGKSSLVVDIPNYTIFNRVSKKGVVKNDLLINENKEDCGSSVQIKVGNDKYIISRATHVYLKTGKKAGDPVYQGKTEVDFKVIHSDGTEEDFNGEQRDVTDTAIRKIFGTPEDFIATSVAPQWQLLGFIDAGSTERLKLIGRYFDVDVFEKKHKLAKDDCKEIKTSIKYLEDKKLELQVSADKEELEKVRQSIVSHTLENNKIKEEFKAVQAKIEKTEKSKEAFHDKTNELNYKEETLIEKIAYFTSINSAKLLHPCTKNPNCCLLKDVEDNNTSKAKLQTLLEEVNRQQDSNDAKLKLFTEANKMTEEERALSILEDKSDYVVEYLYSLNKKEGSLKSQIERSEKDLAELVKLKQKYEIYDYFLLANSKDGISKQIISKNLDIINFQIKKILSNGVNFDIELVSEDDGKAVEILFKHERGKPRKIELCSGMEKSLAAIAIRAALVSVTTLPRSNLFVLDESFSSLDPEYLDAAGKMLNYLKELFDAVIIVTHIDAFKDLADHVIEIVRDDEGYSKIIE